MTLEEMTNWIKCAKQGFSIILGDAESLLDTDVTEAQVVSIVAIINQANVFLPADRELCLNTRL